MENKTFVGVGGFTIQLATGDRNAIRALSMNYAKFRDNGAGNPRGLPKANFLAAHDGRMITDYDDPDWHGFQPAPAGFLGEREIIPGQFYYVDEPARAYLEQLQQLL